MNRLFLAAAALAVLLQGCNAVSDLGRKVGDAGSAAGTFLEQFVPIPENLTAPTASMEADPAADGGLAAGDLPAAQPPMFLTVPPAAPPPLEGPDALALDTTSDGEALAAPVGAPPPPVQPLPREIAPAPESAAELAEGLGAFRHVAVLYFAGGSTELNEHDRGIAAQIANIFTQDDGVRMILVTGHASPISATEEDRDAEVNLVNFKVSLDRAQTVALELMRHGVPQDTIRVEGRGAAEPAVLENGQLGGAAYDRRVEVTFIY